MAERTVPAENFVGTLSVNVDNQKLSVNVDNQKLSDAEFRELVRNTLPIVQFEVQKNFR